MAMFYIFSLIIFLFTRVSLQVQQINIGAIFYEDEQELQRSFEATVEHFNNENKEFKMLTFIRHVELEKGALALQTQTCDLLDRGVVAIFGPSGKAKYDIVAQICNSTGIPHILFDQQIEDTEEDLLHHQMTVNLYPARYILSKAYSDIIQFNNWKKFTIVYDEDDDYALERLQDLIEMHELNSAIVRIRSFKKGDDYRLLWKSIKGERRIILDCAAELLVEVLDAAIEYNLTGPYNHIFLPNLDNFVGSLEDLRNNETFAVNVTAARLRLNGDLYELDEMERSTLYNFDVSSQPKTLLPDLIYDAVNVLVLALRNITTTFQVVRPRVSCNFDQFDDSRTWKMGQYMIKLMKGTYGINNTEFRSNDLIFDEFGQRTGFGLEIYSPLDNYGLAYWNTKGEIIGHYNDEKISKKTIYRVATKIDAPYFMINETAQENNVTGNDLYMGYSVDLIAALAEKVGFEYVFIPNSDNIVGKFNKETKQWNGIIGDLTNNDADMGICDFTITQARRKYVDFTVPFMQLGIALLAYQPPYQPKSAFAFLEPYSVEVWTYILFANIIVTFLFIFMARISKDEWENPHPCNQEPRILENRWGLLDSNWLTIASITTAGCDILPRSPPMRTFNAVWWIFAIIISNSYTANMAAFLTTSKNKGTIESVKDLVEQDKVHFGTMEGGSTYTFFAESNETTYRLAYNIMNNDDPSAYTKSNHDGSVRVLKSQGKYMFLMETTALEFSVESSCFLRMVGEKFSEKHYAIAVPLGADYRGALGVGILKLSEKGELFRLKHKWWKNETRNCLAPSSEDSNELTFEGVRGTFYTLIVGLLFAYILGICEFLSHVQTLALDEGLTYKEVFKREIKFVFAVWNNKKPVITPSVSFYSGSRRSLSRLDNKEHELQEIHNGNGIPNGNISIEDNEF